MIKFISRLNLAGSRVDRDKGVIKGVSLIAMGDARGHDKRCDLRTLETVRDCAKEYGEGLRVKFNPSTFQHGVGSLLGFIPPNTLRIENDKCIGDLHVYKSFPNDAKEYLYEIAERTPGNIGLSIEFTGDDEMVDGNKFARCDQIFAATVVDLPAANPTGLFAEKEPYGDVEYADPGYQSDEQKRYPINTPDHVRAAWSYINQGDNASKYSSEDLTKVKNKIKSAAKAHGVEISDDNKSEDMNMTDEQIQKLATAFAGAVGPVLKQTFADAGFPPPKKDDDDGDGNGGSGDGNGDGANKGEKQPSVKGPNPEPPPVNPPPFPVPPTKQVAEMTAKELSSVIQHGNMQFFRNTGNRPAKISAEPVKNDDPFEARITQHLSAGAKTRGLAIARARKDSPSEYNEWMSKKNPNTQLMVAK